MTLLKQAKKKIRMHGLKSGYNTSFKHGNATRKLPCVAILNNQKCHFSFLVFLHKIGEQVLSGGLVPMGKGGCEETVKKGEYGANTVYICM
jgi:hypothetical protein